VAQDVVQTLMPFGSEIKKVGEQKILPWHDGTKEVSVPIYQLEKLFDYGTELPLTLRETITPLLTPRQGRIPILLLAKGDGFVGLEVDQVIEEQELVIKPIPGAIPAPDYIYGCTVLADGSMTLVVDGVALIDYGTSKAEAIASISSGSNFEPINISAAPPVAALEGTAKKTILIVDDSITERQKLSLILQKRGYQVQQAKDGVDALEQLQKNSAIPLIVCDLEMPRMTGFEFLSVTRQDANFAKIPVIMLTSRSSSQYQQIARSLGAIAYFTKPYLDYQLLSKVEEIVEKRR
jgi:chemotaxis family two-component system sensor histidine kinase/response regulator PixL